MIHCAVGISRSVTLTLAYVMTVTGLTYPEALSVVQYRRPIANPNDGFKRQLEAFGKAEVIFLVHDHSTVLLQKYFVLSFRF